MLDKRLADAVDVGHLRVGPDPDAVVDDSADVLGKLAINRRPDRRDRLVEQDGDRQSAADDAAHALSHRGTAAIPPPAIPASANLRNAIRRSMA